jgi:hypothetical protein
MSERRSLVLSGGRVAELPATDVLPGVHRYHGFPQPYQVSLSYSAANRQITITPSGATFDIWVQGVRYVKTGAQVSTAHANSSGNYYIYYAADGTLTTSTDPWDLTTVSPVAYIYYNASLVDALVLFELHTAERNTEWHLSQHYAIGTFVRSGLEISGYTLNSTANTTKTYAIASGIIVDEDIEYDVTGVADGGPYTILYRSGASDWAWTTTDSYPFKIGTTYIQYNQNNAGSYQLTELGNNTYMNYWVFATTALSANKQIFIVPSQTYHTSLVNAQAEAITSLSWGGLSLPEIAAIWKITYEAKSSYLTAAGRVQMVEVVRISATRSQISGNFSAGTHNALSGRDFADCHPASAIAYTAYGDLPTETVQFVISSLEDRKQEGGYVLDAFNTLTPAADKVPYFTGTDTAALADFTASGRALVAAASADAQRALLSADRGMKNLIVGGDFTTNPWQRGTSFTALANGQFCADAWAVSHSSDAVVDVLKTQDAPTVAQSGVYSRHCIHLDVTTADASIGVAQYYLLRHKMESSLIAHMGFGQAGTRYVTLSFWHKHTKTGTYCVAIQSYDTVLSYIAEYTQSVSDTWEFASLTIPVANTGVGTWGTVVGEYFRFYFVVAAGSNWHTTAGSWNSGNYFCTANQVNGLDSTSNNFKIDLVQLEPGTAYTGFAYRPPQIELLLAHRQFRKQAIWVGTSNSPTCIPIDMRATPTVTGGGAGFTYAPNTTADTLICYQTTAGVQTLELTA